MNRIELLDSLIKFEQPLQKILLLLSSFGWDSDQELVTLERQDIAAILDRYVDNKLSSKYVEDWANALESREDVAYEHGAEDILDKVIYELANPLLTRPLSKNTAKDWIEQLNQRVPLKI